MQRNFPLVLENHYFTESLQDLCWGKTEKDLQIQKHPVSSEGYFTHGKEAWLRG